MNEFQRDVIKKLDRIINLLEAVGLPDHKKALKLNAFDFLAKHPESSGTFKGKNKDVIKSQMGEMTIEEFLSRSIASIEREIDKLGYTSIKHAKEIIRKEQKNI